MLTESLSHYHYIYVQKNVFSFAKIHIFHKKHNISILFLKFSPFCLYIFLKSCLRKPRTPSPSPPFPSSLSPASPTVPSATLKLSAINSSPYDLPERKSHLREDCRPSVRRHSVGQISGGRTGPSVRELAAEYEVNTNTILRTFDILQRDEIIYPKRGICVFVSPGARHKIRIARKQEFRKHELPEFLHRLRLLGMTIDDVVKAWEERQDTKG